MRRATRRLQYAGLPLHPQVAGMKVLRAEARRTEADELIVDDCAGALAVLLNRGVERWAAAWLSLHSWTA